MSKSTTRQPASEKSMTLEEQLLDTWAIHKRINLFVLNGIADEALNGVSASKGRSVAEVFAHIHNNRIEWLKAAAPELMEGLEKIAKENANDKALLQRSLEASGRAVEQLLNKSFAAGVRVKGFKPHTPAFLAYLVAHESYHLGEVGMILTQSGHPLDKKTAYGMWEWGVR